jgi:hypothetical protein
LRGAGLPGVACVRVREHSLGAIAPTCGECMCAEGSASKRRTSHRSSKHASPHLPVRAQPCVRQRHYAATGVAIVATATAAALAARRSERCQAAGGVELRGGTQGGGGGA